MSEFFNNIPKIAYEGKDSKNPLAFKFYNPDEVIAGRTTSRGRTDRCGYRTDT